LNSSSIIWITCFFRWNLWWCCLSCWCWKNRFN
jgi:hypothetical protein